MLTSFLCPSCLQLQYCNKLNILLAWELSCSHFVSVFQKQVTLFKLTTAHRDTMADNMTKTAGDKTGQLSAHNTNCNFTSNASATVPTAADSNIIPVSEGNEGDTDQNQSIATDRTTPVAGMPMETTGEANKTRKEKDAKEMTERQKLQRIFDQTSTGGNEDPELPADLSETQKKWWGKFRADARKSRDKKKVKENDEQRTALGEKVNKGKGLESNGSKAPKNGRVQMEGFLVPEEKVKEKNTVVRVSGPEDLEALRDSDHEDNLRVLAKITGAKRGA